MFVLTADQIDSRHDVDRVAGTIAALESLVAGSLLLPPDRTAGDELQLLLDSADGAVEALGMLARDGHWSIGIGVGAVLQPLPDAARAATGPAFVHARAAVEYAKRSPTRFGLEGGPEGPLGSAGVRALFDLVLALRSRRSPEGWAVVDLLEQGMSQSAVADSLGITPQAVSLRVAASGWKLERAAMPGLISLLDGLDRSA
ncbi:DNA-binding protein [Naasia lichenicola]|uniref:DNA-binding protein n=1 Tax=Naasia lichenicola TaxID=2565933 RepID=A0A4S4FNX3_9MICO|nr:DNA-binding protein [Naasia lichenicola]THG32260.1 DNA-binding protein [Naasia lichenicola]